MQPILIALARLDVNNDDHWTADGMARVDVVSGFMAESGLDPVQRQEIIEASPMFTRETAVQTVADLEAEYMKAHAAPAPPPAAPASPPVVEVATPAPAAPVALAAPPVVTLTNLDPKAQPAVLVVPEGQRVCDLPVAQIAGSADLLERAMGEMTLESQALLEEKKAIDERLRLLSAKLEGCSRQYQLIRPKDDPQKAIQDYLKRTTENQLTKVARAQAFIAAGTNPAEVIKQMDGRSQIDIAMAQRGAIPGSTRPRMGMPVQN